MDYDLLIISKYLVEKPQMLFTRKKQVMSICTVRIILQGLNSNLYSDIDIDEADTINYSDVKEIRVSERSQTEFTIIADKKYDFISTFRNRLV